MSRFKNFQKTHGPSLDCSKVTLKSTSKYKSKLPEPLIEFWQESGWCGYAEGLIWVVNPQYFEKILEEWLDTSSDPSIVFARTALGDLFLWSNNQVYLLDVQQGEVREIVHDIELFFDSFLCDKNILEKVLKKSLYQEALQRLGPPEPNECYAFVPALPLGGSGTADTLEKAKLPEYLSLLAQLILDE